MKDRINTAFTTRNVKAVTDTGIFTRAFVIDKRYKASGGRSILKFLAYTVVVTPTPYPLPHRTARAPIPPIAPSENFCKK
jgi:hypothetical protein